MKSISDLYCDIQREKCAENKCKVQTSQEFAVYCAESLAKSVMGNAYAQKICDCIIANSTEDEISVVELKFRSGKKGVLKGQGLAGRIEDVRAQLANGLDVLLRVLKNLQRNIIKIQVVLYTKSVIKDRSELKQLRKPLHIKFPKLTIQNVPCGGNLPDGYVPVSLCGR